MGRDWVVATDYDGRNDRNLTAIRTRTLKYIRTDGTVSDRECYDLTDDRGETANRIADHPASDSLEALADRRARHETERLAIADGAAAIADTG